jgi:hypothetical protein
MSDPSIKNTNGEKKGESVWSSLPTLATLAVVIVVCLALFVPHEPTTGAASCSVSYDILRIGMSLDEANNAAGCKGRELSRADIAGTTMVYYSWPGPSSMMIGFVNGRLSSKVKF